jgi:hypothetical protein
VVVIGTSVFLVSHCRVLHVYSSFLFLLVWNSVMYGLGLYCFLLTFIPYLLYVYSCMYPRIYINIYVYLFILYNLLTTFRYIGKQTRTIAKLFRNTNIKIAYKTTNTIQNHLRAKKLDNIYNKSGVYQLTCGGCQKKYVGQTGRNFRTRYKEHIHSIKSNNSNSKYAQHILETQHSYGPMKDTMKVLHLNRKGQLMNTWERFHIYKLTKDGLQLNDTHTDTHNPILN